MNNFIAFDSHKRYTLVEIEERSTGKRRQFRVEHSRGAIEHCLKGCEAGTPVAVEATGNWYWIVDEIERAGCVPRLVHPRKAKLMMGMINKTDKLDVHGLNRLQRNETLPTVWIPPAELRDLRELTRTRMVLTSQKTRLKNRILATLSKYGFSLSEYSDSFGKKARKELERCLGTLPNLTAHTTRILLSQLDETVKEIQNIDRSIQKMAKETPAMTRLMTMPGIGFILSVVIALEIGDITRFPSAEHLASYAGTCARVKQSGAKITYGRLRPDVNRYLKWAYVEAAHAICINHKKYPDLYLSKVYQRIKARRNHPKAIGAVARNLAEATYHIWTKEESYNPEIKRG